MDKKSHIPKAENRLRIVLAQQRKNNKWLADELGVNEPTVSNWVTNKAQPRLETFYQIAFLLKVEVRKLFVPTIEKDE
ncbi:MAG TPA: helix-turn-helix transcriptional regulator [Bacteroidia bacterium]|nr:helix-turn-helix transcriptional regulator [Bacteroidia bacterium]